MNIYKEYRKTKVKHSHMDHTRFRKKRAVPPQDDKCRFLFLLDYKKCTTMTYKDARTLEAQYKGRKELWQWGAVLEKICAMQSSTEVGAAQFFPPPTHE